MFETATIGAGYGYGTQQVGVPPGSYGNPAGQQAGVPGAGTFGQPPFGGQAGGQAGIPAQRFGGYPMPQSALPLTLAPGTIPFQQIPSPFAQQQLGQGPWGQPQFGQSPFGQAQFGQPQFGQPPFGQPPFGQPQFGQPQFGQPQFGQPQFGQPQFGQLPLGQQQAAGQQLGGAQAQVQVIPVVTPQGGFGVLLLATGQPLVIGAGGLPGGMGQAYGAPWQAQMGGGQPGLGQIGGLGGAYLPLQFQPHIAQQVPQMYGPTMPVALPSFPGQPFGPMPIH